MVHKKIGIMGGTFNPIHTGHLVLADSAKEQYGLSEIWFMPSKRPPHKQDTDILADEHRIQMVKLAVSGNPDFVLSEFEFERKGISYTSDTVRLLSEQYPEYEFYFIIGGDSLMWLDGWHEPAEIFKYAHILASTREGCSRKEAQEKIDSLKQQFDAQIDYVEIPELAVSSEKIRKGISLGRAVRYLMPEPVYQYIKENKLYLV